MDFSYGSFDLFERIEPDRPTLESTLGGYAMDFVVQFTPRNPPKGAVVVDDLYVGVSFGDKKQDIGIARPAPLDGWTAALSIRGQPHGQQPERVRFRLYLTPTVLEAIEVSRNGGDTAFHLKILGKITGYDIDAAEEEIKPNGIAWSAHVLFCAAPARVYKPAGGYHDCIMRVPQSEWVKVLANVGFHKTILLEIPILESGELGVASTHVRGAQAAFSEGRYADVVARCRDAMDALIDRAPYPWRLLADKERREEMAVEDRLRLSWNGIRHVTHATHHRNGMSGEFTRAMAQYVFGVTSLTLSLAMKERDLFMASKEEAAPGA